MIGIKKNNKSLRLKKIKETYFLYFSQEKLSKKMLEMRSKR